MSGKPTPIWAKYSKLLIISVISSLWLFAGLGQDCLAQVPPSAPKEYWIVLKDQGPFRGLRVTSDTTLRLIRQAQEGRWDLELHPDSQSVTLLAFEDFRLSRHRSGDLNRILMSDWIFNFDPNLVIEKRGAEFHKKSKSAKAAEFVSAWNEYRTQFATDFAAYKESQRLKGYTVAAESFVSVPFLQNGIERALTDPDLLTQLRSAVGQLLLEKFQDYQVEFTDELKTKIIEKSYQTNFDIHLSVVPQFKLEDFDLKFKKSTATGDAFNRDFGTLEVKLPLSEVEVLVRDLKVQSELLPEPYVISKSDELRIRLAFNQDRPFNVSIGIRWNRISQRPELSLNREDFESPLSTGKITSVHFRGKRYEREMGSPSEWILSNEGWGFMQRTLTQGDFIQRMLVSSSQELAKLLEKHLPFRENFVVIENEGSNLATKFRVEPFNPVLKDHDPALNPQMVASFQLTIPIEIQTPEMDLSVRPTEESIAGRIAIRILNPDVELENLKLFWRGKTLSSNDLGFRFRLNNRESGSTRLEAAADLAVSHALSFRLDALKTNLEGLYIRALEVRVRDRWLKGNRPSLDMLLRNAQVLREFLIGPKAQADLTQELQAFVEMQMQKVLGARLQDLEVQIPFDSKEGAVSQMKVDQNVELYTNWFGGLALIEKASLGISGKLRVGRIPMESVEFRLRDFSNQEPTCKGNYLFSAEAGAKVKGMIPIRGEGFKISAQMKKLSETLSVESLVTQVDATKGAMMKLGLDLCLSANREKLEIGLRSVEHTLGNLKISGVQVRGVTARSEATELLARIFGWGSGIDRDLKISEILKGYLESKQEVYFKQLGRMQTGFFQEKLAAFLDTSEVRGRLERAILEIGDIEEKALSLMMDLGKFLKEPLEKMISDNLKKITEENIPKINEAVRAHRQTLDDIILNVGQILGADLEERIFSTLISVLHGRSSFEAMSSGLRELMAPSKASLILRQRFGVAEDLKQEFAWIPQYHQLLSQIPQCPVADVESLMDWKNLVGQMGFESRKQEAIVRFIDESCIASANRPAEQLKAADWYAQGIGSLNEFLMDEAMRYVLRLPSHKEVPLTTGPQEWSTNRGQNVDRDFQIPLQVSKVEMVSTQSDQPLVKDLLRIVFYSSEIAGASDLLMPGRINSEVLTWLEAAPDSVVFQLHRSAINDLLRKIDWAEMLRLHFPTVFGPWDTIDVERAPFLTVNNEILFKIVARSRSGKARILLTPVVKLLARLFDSQKEDDKLNRLVEPKKTEDFMPAVNLSDVAAVALSFLDLKNIFGYDVTAEGRVSPKLALKRTEDGSIISLAFEPVEWDSVQAGMLTTPIQRRLDVAHQPLNSVMADLLSRVGGLPSLEIFSNVMQVDRLELVQGDFMIQIGRRDLMP